MARLPTPGADSGTWGSVLNDFLSVAHNTDGTLKSSVLAGQFSRGATLIDPAVGNVVVWRAPFACTVTKVSGYRTGGTGASINARKNGASTFLSTNLSVATADNWLDGGTVQNESIAAGDSIEIMVVSLTGSPTQVAVQIDFQTA